MAITRPDILLSFGQIDFADATAAFGVIDMGTKSAARHDCAFHFALLPAAAKLTLSILECDSSDGAFTPLAEKTFNAPAGSSQCAIVIPGGHKRFLSVSVTGGASGKASAEINCYEE